MKNSLPGPTLEDSHGVSFAAASRVWVRVALLSFGGPAGQIAVMHRLLVEEKRWIGETRFLHALNYCMLLPGPEAHQLAIYLGWLLHRMRGGLMAGVLFVLPGVISLGALSYIYATFGNLGSVQGLFFGLKAAVIAVVLEAVLRVGKRAIRGRFMLVIAALAFVGIFFFSVPFPLMIAAAALIGLVGRAVGFDGAAKSAASARELAVHLRPSWPRSMGILLIGLSIWLAPLAVLLVTLGPRNVFSAIATFNSRMAVVSFGGAYAALAYMAQQAVEHYHWLKPQEMLVGLGLAETTPGPLISVVQFVGFMAAYREPGSLSPAWSGTLGGLLAQWSTCIPSFIWIFAGAPYIESLRNNQALSAALKAITAAVVGAIANLAIWFALHTLFGEVLEQHRLGITLQLPVLSTLNVPALLLSSAAAIALFRFRAGMIATLLGCCVAGILLQFAAWI